MSGKDTDEEAKNQMAKYSIPSSECVLVKSKDGGAGNSAEKGEEWKRLQRRGDMVKYERLEIIVGGPFAPLDFILCAT